MTLNFKIGDTFKTVSLLAFFILTAQTFSLFPGFQPVTESWFVLCALYLVFVYPWTKLAGQPKTSMFEFYMLVLVLCIPVWQAESAKREFGQPLIYGMLALRGTILIAGVLCFTRRLYSGSITLGDVEKNLIRLIWGLWFLYLFMRLGLNPNSFSKKGFVSVATAEYPAEFLLQPYFLLFGGFYYIFRGFHRKRLLDYVLAFLLVGNALGSSGRGYLVGFLVTFVFLAAKWGNAKRLLSFFPKMALGLAVMIGILFLIAPGEMTRRVDTLRAAFTATLSGQATEDSSANAHLLETAYALASIAKHPLFGNGRISAQWAGGAEGVRGVLFYAADIGLLGVAYEVGIVGTLLYGMQLFIAWRASRKQPRFPHMPLIDAAKALLVYSALPLTSGIYATEAPLTLIFVVIVTYAANHPEYWTQSVVARRAESSIAAMGMAKT